MDFFLFSLALACYGGATLGYLTHLLSPTRGAAAAATPLTVAGFTLHSLAFLVKVMQVTRPPLGNLYESLLVLTWTIVLIYLNLEHHYRHKMLGAFVLPIVVAGAGAALALPRGAALLTPAPTGPWLWTHVSLVLVGNAAFVFAFSTALMYLIQERQIKSHNPGTLSFRLPSLELLDDLCYKFLIVGFPLLTLGLITGSIWAQHLWGAFWTWNFKQIWSLITWTIYAGLLVARLFLGLRGRKAAIVSIVGFGAVLFTLLGVSLLTRGLHASG